MYRTTPPSGTVGVNGGVVVVVLVDGGGAVRSSAQPEPPTGHIAVLG